MDREEDSEDNCDEEEAMQNKERVVKAIQVVGGVVQVL